MYTEVDELLRDAPPHMRRRYRRDIGQRVVAGDKFYCSPSDGNGQPSYDDPYISEPIDAVGTDGWSPAEQKSEWVNFDFDGANHSAGLTDEQLKDIIDRASALPEVEISRSKSGEGFHCLVYVDMPATTRRQHLQNAAAVKKWFCEKTGIDPKLIDCCGGIAWIWHRNAAPNGFELIKEAVGKVPPLRVEPEPSQSEAEPITFGPRQQKIVNWLRKHGHCEIEGTRVRTHTADLAKAAAAPSLHIRGSFSTVATGSQPGDWNCFMYPRADDDGFDVYRYGDATEPGWTTSKNGHVHTTFDAKKKSVSQSKELVQIGLGHELFSAGGRAYANATYNGIRDTYLIGDERYRQLLRREYTLKTGEVADEKHIRNACADLSAIAQHDRPTLDVFTRVGRYRDAIYYDLADTKRRAVKITADGWEVVDDTPLCFRRSAHMLPMPEPERGSIDLLRPFLNLSEDEFRLVVGWMLQALRPSGPYPVLVFVGSPGAAKTSISRALQRLIDPNGGDVRGEPKNVDDLVIAALHSHLVIFDNVSHVKQQMSDAYCRLSTGGGIGKRKLYTDETETVFHSQRPLLINAVKDVVTAPDLLDRSIVIELDSLDRVKPEADFWAEFEAVRPRIFGALLDAMSCAMRNLSATKLDNPPRMSDFAHWVTAAEPALGFASGSILAAYDKNRKETAMQTFDDFGHALKALAKDGFDGEAAELLTALLAHSKSADIPRDVRKLGSELRMLAPVLRADGIHVSFRKVNGRRKIKLGTR